MKLVNMKRDEETANASLFIHSLTPAAGPGLSSVPGCEHDERNDELKSKTHHLPRYTVYQR